MNLLGRAIPLVCGAGGIIALIGCGDTGARPTSGAAAGYGGTVVIVVPADFETLLPPYATAVQAKMVAGLLFERLADIGDGMNTRGDAGFVPALADRWTWSPDSLSIAFHLNPAARWHDGVPVTSRDVRFTYRLDRDSAVGTEITAEIARIDSVTTPDSLTAVFWFRHRYPEQFFDATYQMLICPEHLLGKIPPAELRNADFGHHPVGTGRFQFASWTPGSSLEIIADTTNARGRAKLDRVIFSVAPDFSTALTRLFSGEADIYEYLPAESFPELARHPELRGVPYTVPSYGFLWFNLRKPLFTSRPLRRALWMALDRDRMVRNVFDTLGSVPRGPYLNAAAFADTTVVSLPYDTLGADRILDSLGWKRQANRVRARAGKPLAFDILVPTSSAPRKRFALLIQDQLARRGVQVAIVPLEFGTFHTRLRSHDFDAAINVWVNDPSPSGEREAWSSAGERGGLNWGSYSDPAFDAALDSALTVMDGDRARRYFHRAFQTITDDAPAVWLYNAKQVVTVHRRLRMAPIRQDAWWAHLPDWWIPADERIARDEIGLRAKRRD